MRTAGIVVLLIVSAGLMGSIAVMTAQNPPLFIEAMTIAKDAQGFSELRERFQTLAREKGAVYAYEVLRRATLPSNTDMHLLGHAVGDILYEQKGAAGVADCTQDFRNACSHSVIIGALNEFGESALDMIRDACHKAPGGRGAYTMCYHGLGHGVFAYFDYDLAQTVDFCKKTGTEEYRDREYIECVGGAVMELMGGGGHNRALWRVARQKYLDPEDPLAPCLPARAGMDAVIPDKTKAQCLTYLTPRLWELADISIATPDPSLFPEAFAFCNTIPMSQQLLRDACFGGFGKEFIVLAGERDIRDVASLPDDAYHTTIRWCMRAPADDGKRACVQDAVSSVFWGGENDPSASFRFCGLVDDIAIKDACYERLSTAIPSYIHDEAARHSLCERLPDEKRETCRGTK